MRLQKITGMFLSIFLFTNAQAALRPLVSIALGTGEIDSNLNQTLTLLPPFQNSYVSNQNHAEEDFGEVFLGIESSWQQTMLWQLGLAYAQNNPTTFTGNVYQLADQNYNNLAYSFQFQSQRLLLESKLLFSYHHAWHPYFMANLGEAINHAYGYQETPLAEHVVPMAQPFADHKTDSFTYTLGAGIEFDLNAHLRLGGGYRYVDFGSLALDSSPSQQTSQTLSDNHLHANEVLLQLSYII